MSDHLIQLSQGSFLYNPLGRCKLNQLNVNPVLTP